MLPVPFEACTHCGSNSYNLQIWFPNHEASAHMLFPYTFTVIHTMHSTKNMRLCTQCLGMTAQRSQLTYM